MKYQIFTIDPSYDATHKVFSPMSLSGAIKRLEENFGDSHYGIAPEYEEPTMQDYENTQRFLCMSRAGLADRRIAMYKLAFALVHSFSGLSEYTAEEEKEQLFGNLISDMTIDTTRESDERHLYLFFKPKGKQGKISGRFHADPDRLHVTVRLQYGDEDYVDFHLLAPLNGQKGAWNMEALAALRNAAE